MNWTKSFFKKNSVCLLAVALFSCSAHGISYEAAFEAYCELYNVENWNGVDDTNSLQEVYGFIATEALKIENSTFQNDLNKLGAERFSDFHQDVHKIHEERVGSRWQCSSFDQFFFPSQRIVEISFGDEIQKSVNPDDMTTLVIMITGSGDILVDNHPLSDSSLETLSRAVDVILQSKSGNSTDVYIYLDEGADGGSLFDILTMLRVKGIGSLGLIGI